MSTIGIANRPPTLGEIIEATDAAKFNREQRDIAVTEQRYKILERGLGMVTLEVDGESFTVTEERFASDYQ